MKNKKFLRYLVDIVWNECTESEEVPATVWADKMIRKAYKTFKEEKPVKYKKPVKIKGFQSLKNIKHENNKN